MKKKKKTGKSTKSNEQARQRMEQNRKARTEQEI